MRSVIRKGKQEMQDNSKTSMSEEMLGEAGMVFNINYNYSQEKMLINWEDQYNEQCK